MLRNNQPLPNSKKVMVNGSALSTKVLLKTANKAARKALINPTKIPVIISHSVLLTISKTPGIINKPKLSSSPLILRLKTIGSIRAVKKEVVAMHINEMEALANLTAPKKQIQCIETRTPIPIYFMVRAVGKAIIFFFMLVKKGMLKVVIPIRHHTSTSADKVIRSPNMAVNPKRRTAICNSK